MSLRPAQRLEKATPSAGKKGRLQEGADADTVVFDPEKVTDRASYAAPAESIGIEDVLVSGTRVVNGGKLVENVFPGRALTSR